MFSYQLKISLGIIQSLLFILQLHWNGLFKLWIKENSLISSYITSPIKRTENEKDLHCFLQYSLIDIRRPNPGNTETQNQRAAESLAVSFHYCQISPESRDREVERKTILGTKKHNDRENTSSPVWVTRLVQSGPSL